MKQNLLQSLRLRFALLVALLCSLGTGTAWADDPSVTFTFNTTAGLSELGITAPSKSSGTDLGDDEYTKSPITMTATDGGTHTRVWNSKDVYTLRVYSSSPGGSLTFSTSSSYNIKTVALGSGTWTANTGTMDGTNWSGTAQSVTFSCTTNATISTITITYVPTATPHNLSSAVSPSATGSVTLGATTVAEGATTSISATPNVGYRFVNWTVSGTGSSVESTTSASTTFTMGTADATVTANFEEIPLHTLSSAVSPVGAGTVTLGATSVREGSTTTASAAAAVGYKFKGWSISGTGASLSSTTTNPTTVTMGTANATVTATFEAVTTHAIKWSVNGSIVKTENVPEDDDISFAAPASGVPTGYTFKGWVVEANRIDGTTDTDPKANYVTEATSTADITYYAVLAVGNVAPATVNLTANTSWSGYADKEFTDDKGNKWTANCTGQNVSGTLYYGLKAATSSYVKSPVFSGNITNIVIWASNGSSTENRTFYIKTTQAGESGDLGTISVPKSSSGAELTATLGGSSFTTFYLGASAALQFKKISVTYNATSYSHFCTTVEDYPVTIGSAGYTTYVTPDKVTMPSGVKAYKATAVNTSTIHMEEVTNVPADEPIVLGAAAGTYYLPVITTSTDDVSDNKLLASDGNVTGDESTIYALGKKNGEIGFYLVAEGVKVPAGKAYLDTAGGGSVKEFLTFDFDADAINTAQGSGFKVQDSEIFNLAGQKMSRLQKGINIVNGRKVLVK